MESHSKNGKSEAGWMVGWTNTIKQITLSPSKPTPSTIYNYSINKDYSEVDPNSKNKPNKPEQKNAKINLYQDLKILSLNNSIQHDNHIYQIYYNF